MPIPNGNAVNAGSRRIFARAFLSAGVPAEKVRKLSLHESVTLTERYSANWSFVSRMFEFAFGVRMAHICRSR
jgi:hypothetical protein